MLLEECEDTLRVVREKYWYEELHPLYNIQKPGQTKAEIRHKHYMTNSCQEAHAKRRQTKEHKEYMRIYRLNRTKTF